MKKQIPSSPPPGRGRGKTLMKSFPGARFHKSKKMGGANSFRSALVFAVLLLVSCGSKDVKIVEHDTYELRAITLIELLDIVNIYFDGSIRNLLAFEGADLDQGNNLKLNTADKHVEISGSKEFIAYTKILLQAYEDDRRMDWIRKEVGQGNVFRIDESGFGFTAETD